ncbi:MAG: 1-deoxy-D-xylulose-5-phosphate reductoisomerase [Spirochaetia bacterium]|nr:1-deoxy-D-xylulose-5-phosphate reductoisomerase [Spirochaetia bacterium]
MDVQKIIILGATGSIGDSVLKIVRKYRDLFQLVGISYHSNHQKASEITFEFQIPNVYCSNSREPINGYDFINQSSYEKLLDIDYDMVIVAVVGSAGVLPTYHAVCQGKKILLANKESLVMAGSIIMQAAIKNHAKILPVDSEHNSLFRLLAAVPDYQKLTITASGGALRSFPLDKFSNVTVEDVLKHPTWSMGAKITVDSATMVNKSLEIIEAHHLFNKEYSELSAVIHPESFVHAILKHTDGSSFFHVYKPDMIYSIAFCMFYPELPPSIVESTRDELMTTLNFYNIAPERYPGYYLGIKAGEQEGIFPSVFNAANEQAVSSFLSNQISYTDIIPLVSNALDQCSQLEFDESLAGLLMSDNWARDYVKGFVIK